MPLKRTQPAGGALEDKGIDVARGVFGARMEVQIANDGPATVILET
jgi:D-aminoacyl-tRNA deacylase